MINQRLVESLLIMPFERAAFYIELLGITFGREYHDELVRVVLNEHKKKVVA